MASAAVPDSKQPRKAVSAFFSTAKHGCSRPARQHPTLVWLAVVQNSSSSHVFDNSNKSMLQYLLIWHAGLCYAVLHGAVLCCAVMRLTNSSSSSRTAAAAAEVRITGHDVFPHCCLCRVLRQYLQQHGSQAKAIFLVAGQLQVKGPRAAQILLSHWLLCHVAY